MEFLHCPPPPIDHDRPRWPRTVRTFSVVATVAVPVKSQSKNQRKKNSLLNELHFIEKTNEARFSAAISHRVCGCTQPKLIQTGVQRRPDSLTLNPFLCVKSPTEYPLIHLCAFSFRQELLKQVPVADIHDVFVRTSFLVVSLLCDKSKTVI